MIFLKLWFGLAVRYRLPRQRRIEGPSSILVLNLFCGGPLWLDHLVFAIRPFVFADMSGAGEFSGGPHAFEQNLVLGSFVFL
jgi:hypothetical protein